MSVIVERDNIGIFGRINSGKSSIMNLLTQQETSIVDSAPGTTADTKKALLEIHGLGPVALYDTAGIDESGVLGEKKRKKVFGDLKECDLVLLVINPAAEGVEAEDGILRYARSLEKQVLVVYNLFEDSAEMLIPEVERELPLLRFYKKTVLCARVPCNAKELSGFIIENYVSKNEKLELLPFIKPDSFYLLVIPMDAETPGGRFLRPQAMTEEYITRKWSWPVSFRLDLDAARSSDPVISADERSRFSGILQRIEPHCVITDSQAVDVVEGLVPADIFLTTFSIVMINYFSRGRLDRFSGGLIALDRLGPGDSVLIAEACNHSRIGEDIGTVQIPRIIKEKFPGVKVEHSFGREFTDEPELADFKLIIHCGGCMISARKLEARLRDLDSAGVPYTNYGIFLAWAQGRSALERVLTPWGLERA